MCAAHVKTHALPTLSLPQKMKEMQEKMCQSQIIVAWAREWVQEHEVKERERKQAR